MKPKYSVTRWGFRFYFNTEEEADAFKSACLRCVKMCVEFWEEK